MANISYDDFTGLDIATKLQTIYNTQKEVYEAGKAAGGGGGSDEYYNTFWDNFTKDYKNDGTEITRANYTNGFYGSGWNDTTFNPPQGTLIQPTSANWMFQGSRITKLDEGVVDFSGVAPSNGTVDSVFASCSQLKTLPTIDFSNAKITTLKSVFNNCSALTTIGTLKLNPNGGQAFVKYDGTQTINGIEVPKVTWSAFKGCTNLTSLTIDGSIDNDIDLRDCHNLSKASFYEIFEHLDYVNPNQATITFSKTAKTKAGFGIDEYGTDEWEIIKGEQVPNWTISLI